MTLATNPDFAEAKRRAYYAGRSPLFHDAALAAPIDTRRLPPVDAISSALIDRQLIRFMKHTWPMVVPGTDFLPNWHLEAICEHLEAVLAGQIRRLIINIPPRCCKSLSCNVFFPSWAWQKDPSIKFIFASHAQNLATRDSLDMRRLIESDWYKDRYKPDPNWSVGDRFRYPGVVLEKDQNAKSYYQNTASGHRLALSVGSGLTGHGADIIVVDDPHDATEAMTSEAARQHTLTWWGGTLSTRLNPGSKYSAKIVIMQRLHENDVVGHLLRKKEEYYKAVEELKNSGVDPNSPEGAALRTAETNVDVDDIDWDHLCLPAEFNPKHKHISRTKLGFKDPRQAVGELLWAAGLSRSKINSLRVELGSYGASGQLDQLPVPVGGGQIKGEWFKKVPRAEWPVVFDEEIQSWDLSYSDDPTADFTVGFVMGRVGAKIYLQHRVRGQLAFNDQVKFVRALSVSFPEARAKYIEKAANARAVHNTLDAEIPGLILLPATESKVARAWAWTPYLQAGNIHVPDWAPWVDEFLQECESFPLGTHDDQVDAASLGINQLLNTNTVTPQVDVDTPKYEGWKY